MRFCIKLTDFSLQEEEEEKKRGIQIQQPVAKSSVQKIPIRRSKLQHAAHILLSIQRSGPQWTFKLAGHWRYETSTFRSGWPAALY